MKIAYLSTFYPFRGGIAQFNASLYRAFEKENEVKAFTFKRQYPEILFPGKTQMVQENDHADKIPAQRTLDTVNPFTYISTAKAIKNVDADILVMKYWMPFFAPALGYISGKTKAKSIAIIDNAIPHEKHFYDAPLSKYFLNRCDGFVVMSDSVKKDLLSLKPNAKFIQHAHPFYDHFGAIVNKGEARKSLNIADNQKVILFFGFIRAYKGLDILLEAFINATADYTLVIAGEPYEDFSKYQPAVDELKKQGKNVIDIVRYIDDHEVATLFSAADVAALPYKSATQSGIASIAMHFEIPMIVTNVGGLPEEVENGKTGMVVDKVEPILFWKSVEEYFSKSLKENFQKRIRETKEERSWKKLADRIVEFSKSL